MSFDIGPIPDFVVEGNEIEESDVVCKVDRCQFSAKQQTLTFYEEELGKWPWVKTDWKKLQHDVWQHFGHAFNILSNGRKVFIHNKLLKEKTLNCKFLHSTLCQQKLSIWNMYVDWSFQVQNFLCFIWWILHKFFYFEIPNLMIDLDLTCKQHCNNLKFLKRCFNNSWHKDMSLHVNINKKTHFLKTTSSDFKA